MLVWSGLAGLSPLMGCVSPLLATVLLFPLVWRRERSQEKLGKP